MKLRWAVLLGLIDSLAVAVLTGSYNGSTPPGYGSLRALVGWPTGSPVTLFLVLFAVWACCLLCVSWQGVRVPWWQRLIIMFSLLATSGLAYQGYEAWRMR